MKAMDLIRWALKLTDESTARLVEDMRDRHPTRPTVPPRVDWTIR
jgi:hypothetical protein